MVFLVWSIAFLLNMQVHILMKKPKILFYLIAVAPNEKLVKLFSYLNLVNI